MLCYVCDVKDRVFSFYKNEDMSKPSVGRPFSVDEDTFTAAMLRFQNEIVKDSKIVSKSSKIWAEISQAIENKLSPSSLYTMVMTNKYFIRNKLLEVNVVSERSISENEVLAVQSLSEVDSSFDTSANADERIFNIFLNEEEFESIIQTNIAKCSTRFNKKKRSERKYRCFKPGLWLDLVQRRITQASHIKCGFNFEGHYVNLHENKGNFKGKYDDKILTEKIVRFFL